ncbi:MAG: histidine kinase N-terminal 7TM domain-containing protein [Candidatus Bathyarchaeia archaeon]
METLPYIIVAAGVSFLAIVATISYASRLHEARNKVTVLILCGSVIWLLMSALTVSSDNVATKLIFYKMQFVGVLIIPTTWLILTMQLSGYERWVKRSNLVVLSVVPVITLLLIFTNESHGLMWSNITLNSVNSFFPLNETRGLGYWLLIVGYSYFVLMFAVIIFVRRIVASRSLYRRQAVPLIFVACVPWIFSGIFFVNPSLSMYIDLTPLGLAVATSITLWRLAYLPGADVIPVAHEIIVDSLNDAVIILDSQSRIVDLNPKAQDLVGHTISDALGKPVERMWAEWARTKKELDSGTERVREMSFDVGEEKKVYEMQSSYLSGITSERPNLLIILRDITERKSMDEKLRLYSKQLKEHSEHLEELVAERTKELREAERMAAIGETAAMVGHDLRNPLQAISSATYLLKQKPASKIDEETKEMIEIIEESVQHSNRIVSDLLEYSRKPKLKLDETDLSHLVKDAVASTRIPEGIRVKLAVTELRLTVDPEMIRRVFINIITNAVDAMPNGGELVIGSRESDDSFEISFTDTGTGISNEAMERLWKPLNTTKAKGSGLGLAICKRIVEAHNGSISVRTALGKGTTLDIALPIKPRIEDVNEAQAK